MWLYKKGVLKNLCWRLFLKLQALGLQLCLKKTPTRVFSCEYSKNIKNSDFHRTPLDDCFCKISLLTHFQPMFHFYTPWKHQKISGFLMLSGGVVYRNIGWKWVNPVILLNDHLFDKSNHGVIILNYNTIILIL